MQIKSPIKIENNDEFEHDSAYESARSNQFML